MGAAQSSLLEAAASGDARRVRELLSAGKDGAAVAAATEEHGWSWLHIAAFKGCRGCSAGGAAAQSCFQLPN
eukprot:jgi/Tetstr1/464284/TSEL_009086.t2